MAHVATITIDHTKVAGDLTDYVGLIVPDASAGYSALYALCLEGGGDIRLFKSDDTTELAREIVTFSVSAETGEIHYKYSGTLSSSVDTAIHVYADGSSAEPAAGSTYGSEAVWGDYALVDHLSDLTSSTTKDSTSNGRDGNKTSANQPNQISAVIGEGQDFNQANEEYINYDGFKNVNTSNPFTISMWVNIKNLISGANFVAAQTSPSAQTRPPNFSYSSSSGGNISFNSGNGSASFICREGNLSNNTWYYLVGQYDGSDLIQSINAGTPITDTVTGSLVNDTTNDFRLGWTSNGAFVSLDGRVDNLRIRPSSVSSEWRTTEYNNQNSYSTFYSVAAVAGSSAAQAARRGAVMMM